MSSDVIISVENMSKRYRLGQIGATTLRESFERGWHRLRGRDPDVEMGIVGVRERIEQKGRRSNAQKETKETKETVSGDSAPHDDAERISAQTSLTSLPSVQEKEIWAIRDVSFEVKRGEVLGVIGRNGAGKSTLLKILSRITEPTQGRAVLRGRVGSLLEVGTGFHPELTGRENVYLNGAILGMKKREIDARFDEIVTFAEIERFVDTPVKRYSSGMYVRLAFAVAAHLDPEILLVDEVLAVGDFAFRAKCLGKMKSVAGEGRTVLFVSHNMASIQSLCERVLLLGDGRVVETGPTDRVVDHYLAMGSELSERPLSDRTDRRGNGEFKFTSVTFADEDGRSLSALAAGRTTIVEIGYTTVCERDASLLQVSMGFRNSAGQFLFYCPSQFVAPIEGKLRTSGKLTCTIPRFPLPEGSYRFSVYAELGGEIADWIEDAGAFNVSGGDFYGTGRVPARGHKGVLVNYAWKVADNV